MPRYHVRVYEHRWVDLELEAASYGEAKRAGLGWWEVMAECDGSPNMAGLFEAAGVTADPIEDCLDAIARELR
jgi:hypothetical protein